MKKIFIILLLLVSVNIAFSQDVRLENAIPTGNNQQTNPLWGNDVVVLAYEPIGPMVTGKLGDTIFVAINDTLSTVNLGLIIKKSTNNGANWTLHGSGITYRNKIDRLVFTNAGLGPDSLYLFMLIENTIYRWNIPTGSFAQILTAGNYRTFDVTGSSTGALYLFGDVLTTNQIPRYASTDGGFTWPITATVTSTGAIPRVSQMVDGDTLILNYYDTGSIIGGDTTTAKIRSARYRQTANGTLGSQNFQDVIPAGDPKPQYKSAKVGIKVWLIYSVGTTGNMNIKGCKSDTGGVVYNAPVDIAVSPNEDEYWFDISVYTFGTTGFDLIYYSDSLQTGPPTNNTDKILYCFSNANSTNFSSPVRISEHPPEWSANGYIPQIVFIPPSDLGTIWVGLDGSNKKVYWDRYSAVTKIRNANNEIPAKYNLSQNYPNPFNPITKIQFEIPKNGFVTLKIYNVLGKEVSSLISKEMNAGIYTVDFDASNLSSGVYFYSIEVNDFKDTKKMMLVK